MTRALTLGGVALSLALTGCGTVMNLYLPQEHSGSESLRVYGGVADTTKAIRLNAEKKGVTPKLVAAALVLDVPLSAVGDTLTLPVSVAVSAARALDAHRHQPPIDPEERKRLEENERNQPPGQFTPERIHGGIQ
jgi:uncharacterized protein YceK